MTQPYAPLEGIQWPVTCVALRSALRLSRRHPPGVMPSFFLNVELKTQVSKTTHERHLRNLLVGLGEHLDTFVH
jgi:hypothetical protein